MPDDETTRGVSSRLGAGIAAVSLASLGLTTLAQGGWYSRRFLHYFDFGEAHIPVGALFLVFGAWFAWYAIRGPARPER